MHATDIVGATYAGDIFCADCYRSSATLRIDGTPVFADQISGDDTCGACLEALEDVSPYRPIVVGRPSHLVSADAYAMVDARHGVQEITDACAVTIASWWQSPTGPGRAFAELASSGTVDRDDLRAAIVDAYATADARDRRALDMLGTWAIHGADVIFADA